MQFEGQLRIASRRYKKRASVRYISVDKVYYTKGLKAQGKLVFKGNTRQGR